MRKGTKSLLFGVHQFLIHPLIVAFCWWKLYGFPFDPRLWACFFLHDIGYFGSLDMDGMHGKWHPVLGAQVVGIFGEHWFWFCLCHSRKMATESERSVSKLCVADKMAVLYTPMWLHNRDELKEYMSFEKTENKHTWKNLVNLKVRDFVAKNKDTADGPEDYRVQCIKL